VACRTVTAASSGGRGDPHRRRGGSGGGRGRGGRGHTDPTRGHHTRGGSRGAASRPPCGRHRRRPWRPDHVSRRVGWASPPPPPPADAPPTLARGCGRRGRVRRCARRRADRRRGVERSGGLRRACCVRSPGAGPQPYGRCGRTVRVGARLGGCPRQSASPLRARPDRAAARPPAGWGGVSPREGGGRAPTRARAGRGDGGEAHPNNHAARECAGGWAVQWVAPTGGGLGGAPPSESCGMTPLAAVRSPNDSGGALRTW